MKYSTGDRVKTMKVANVDDLNGKSPEAYIGEMATIIDIDPTYHYPYELKFDNEELNDGDVCYWSEDEIIGIKLLNTKIKLYDVVIKFMTDNNISCEDTVYQSDRVIENAYGLIVELFNIVESELDLDDE